MASANVSPFLCCKPLIRLRLITISNRIKPPPYNIESIQFHSKLIRSSCHSRGIRRWIKLGKWPHLHKTVPQCSRMQMRPFGCTLPCPMAAVVQSILLLNPLSTPSFNWLVTHLMIFFLNWLLLIQLIIIYLIDYDLFIWLLLIFITLID